MTEGRSGLTRLLGEGRAGAALGGARAAGRDGAALLADVPLFAGLSRRQLAKVAGVATTKRYAAGSALVRAGDAATAFYVILDGRFRVVLPGRRVELGGGDVFGEMALIDGEPRSASVVAESESYVMAIPRPRFLKLLEAEPKIAIALLATLTRRLRAVQATAAG
jgi:CRP-like cAMP-binding protein